VLCELNVMRCKKKVKLKSKSWTFFPFLKKKSGLRFF